MSQIINIYNSQHLDAWTKTLNVPEEVLIEAVARVGQVSDDVKSYLWQELKNDVGYDY